jgi:hypothetical protein
LKIFKSALGLTSTFRGTGVEYLTFSRDNLYKYEYFEHDSLVYISKK